MSEMIPILLYHSIAARSDPRYRRWAVPPDAFDAQMTLLADRGYMPVTV